MCYGKQSTFIGGKAEGVRKGVEIIEKAFEEKLNIIDKENREILDILKQKDQKIAELSFAIKNMERENTFLNEENIKLKEELNETQQLVKELRIENEKLISFRNSIGSSLCREDANCNILNERNSLSLNRSSTIISNNIGNHLSYNLDTQVIGDSRSPFMNQDYLHIREINERFSPSSQHLGRFEQKIANFKAKLKGKELSTNEQTHRSNNCTSSRKLKNFYSPVSETKVHIKDYVYNSNLTGKSSHYIMVSKFFNECRIILPEQKYLDVLNLLNKHDINEIDSETIKCLKEILEPHNDLIRNLEIISSYNS
jgi:hypothetical protein